MMTVPILTLLGLVSTVTLPLAVPAALVVDLVRRRRFSTLRSILFFNFYLMGELGFVYGLLIHWLLMAGWTQAGKRRLVGYAQRRSDGWGVWLQRGAEIFFGIRIEELEPALVLDPSAPVVLLLRHVSMGDTVIPAVAFGRQRGRRVQYIAKRELQMDPIFDIIGGRIGVCFVDRASGRTEEELAPIRAMAQALVPGDVLGIYPEGTRWTRRKLERAKQSAKEKLPPAMAERAQRLRNLLPPRLGGPLAILDGAPANTQIVFASHVGYEGTTSLRDLLNGRAVGRRIKLKLDVVRLADLPTDHDARGEWLFDRWLEIDAWVTETRAAMYPNEVVGEEPAPLLEPAADSHGDQEIRRAEGFSS